MSRQKNHTDALPPYVVLKSGAWYVRRTFATTETYENGKRKRLEITLRCLPETEDRARELSDEIAYEVRHRHDERERPKTAGEYIETFLTIKGPSVARRTAETYQSLYKRYVVGSQLASMPLSDVKTRTVQEFCTGLRASPAMVRKVYQLVSMVFRQAVVWEDLPKNPATGVVLPKSEALESIALSKTDARKLIPVLRSRPGCLIFEFAFETGLRPQEVIALSWSDIDFTKQRVRVNKAIALDLSGGGFEVKTTKTRASVRSVPFSEYMSGRLAEHRILQQTARGDLERLIRQPVAKGNARGVNYKKRRVIRKHRVQTLRNFQKYDLVFPSSNGLPHSLRNLNQRFFKAALADAGIDQAGLSIKSLRHTYASIMAHKVPLKRLQQLMGHASPLTTLKYYIHVDDADENQISERFTEEIYL